MNRNSPFCQGIISNACFVLFTKQVFFIDIVDTIQFAYPIFVLIHNLDTMKYILPLLVIALFSTCIPKTDVVSTSTLTPLIKPLKKNAPKVKNIILMIGDGMGLTQITAGLYSREDSLNLEKFPIVGLHKSYAADNLVTDSAAGATAFACGIKTYNGAIGVNRDSLPVQSILEEATNKNIATGLIATSSIVHATPASFIAHQAQRKMYEAIAADFLKTDVNIFIGGGKKYFDNRDTDDRNLYKELQNKGYYVDDFFNTELENISLKPKEKFAYFTANEEPLPATQGRDYLPIATEKAIQHLNKEDNGFFLMIEGSQIDWGGHVNNSEYIVSETLDFDTTVGKVLEFAKNDGETLVIVTADHETGGYSITPGSTRDSLITAFTTDKHTAVLIPVFAFGPRAELFSGIYENIDIHHRMRMALGWQ